MYCIASPFQKTFDDIGLTYFVPDFLVNDLKIGQVIEIPLKNDIEDAIVLAIIGESEIEQDKIKSIINIKITEPLLEPYQVELIKYIAKYYFSQIHNCVNLFLPKNIRDKIKKGKLTLNNNNPLNSPLSVGESSISTPPLIRGGREGFCSKLSQSQIQIYNQIIEEKNNKILLYGITGSGKTEIYIKLMQKYLQDGKQVLFLIPEIILTNQIGERIKKVFGEEVIIINSNITDTKKANYWLKIKENKAKVVVGTRSAIFLPFVDLGLIIMDEEHDNSYISDKSPRYNSIEIIEKSSELLDIKIVLGSGTPSVGSMYKGVKGEYKILNLLNKFV